MAKRERKVRVELPLLGWKLRPPPPPFLLSTVILIEKDTLRRDHRLTEVLQSFLLFYSLWIISKFSAFRWYRDSLLDSSFCLSVFPKWVLLIDCFTDRELFMRSLEVVWVCYSVIILLELPTSLIFISTKYIYIYIYI